MMKVVLIVQARVGSARLPGKALLALAGRPMLDHVLERAAATVGVDDVVLATPTQDAEILWPLAQRRGLRTWAGSETDVLARLQGAAAAHAAAIVVRVTADCPFWAPDVGAHVLHAFMGAGVEYLSNDTRVSGYPDGTDTEVFSRAILDRAHASARAPGDREHVTPWIRRHGVCGVLNLASADYSWLKMSVDRPEDYAWAQRVAARIPAGQYAFDAVVAAACQEAR